jgi:hypothetical protein
LLNLLNETSEGLIKDTINGHLNDVKHIENNVMIAITALLKTIDVYDEGAAKRLIDGDSVTIKNNIDVKYKASYNMPDTELFEGYIIGNVVHIRNPLKYIYDVPITYDSLKQDFDSYKKLVHIPNSEHIYTTDLAANLANHFMVYIQAKKITRNFEGITENTITDWYICLLVNRKLLSNTTNYEIEDKNNLKYNAQARKAPRKSKLMQTSAKVFSSLFKRGSPQVDDAYTINCSSHVQKDKGRRPFFEWKKELRKTMDVMQPKWEKIALLKGLPEKYANYLLKYVLFDAMQKFFWLCEFKEYYRQGGSIKTKRRGTIPELV